VLWTLSNTHSAPVEVWIEPWGDLFVLAARQKVSVVVAGPDVEGNLEITLEDGTFTIWAWTGASIEFLDPSTHGRLGFWGPLEYLLTPLVQRD
jgi:hypothetical protein